MIHSESIEFIWQIVFSHREIDLLFKNKGAPGEPKHLVFVPFKILHESKAQV